MDSSVLESHKFISCFSDTIASSKRMYIEATIFGSATELILACLILLVAQTVYVLFGFGLGLISIGLMSIFIHPVAHVVVLNLIISIPAEIYVVYKSWKYISWKGVFSIVTGVVAGIIGGTLILRYGSPDDILTILAIFLIISGIIFLTTRSQSTANFNWPSYCLPVVGVVSGLLTGMFGTGGPPLILFYQLTGMKKHEFRGHLMAVFSLMTCIRIPSYALSGLFSVERFISAMYVFPVIVIGMWLGIRIHLNVSEERFRKMISIALVIIGINLFIKKVLG